MPETWLKNAMKNARRIGLRYFRWKTVKEENIWHQVNEVQIKNTSKIFHLLENGHVKWLFGKNTGGYVPGKHWAEKTREEWKDKFPSDVKDHVDDMLGRHNL